MPNPMNTTSSVFAKARGYVVEEQQKRVGQIDQRAHVLERGNP